MASQWRSSVAVGIVLLVLGIGNWVMGAGKVAEYTASLAGTGGVGVLGDFEEFSELDARTNADLLRPLHGESDVVAAVNAKLDFYKVVLAGGKLITLSGMALVLFAIGGPRLTRAFIASGTRPG